MIEILFKLKENEEFRKLELDKSSLQHCNDTELLSMEIKDYLYGEIADENDSYDDFEDKFDSIIFKNGDYWNNVVEPLYQELHVGNNEDYDDDGCDRWFEDERW